MEPSAAAPWQVDAVDVLETTLGLAIAVAILVIVYRTMQRPRIHPVRVGPERKPAFSWQTIVRYMITTPFMVAFWFLAILVILSWAARNRSPEDMALSAAGVVAAARLLAHVDEEMSRELGKIIPLAVIGVILIGRESATVEQVVRAWNDFVDHMDDIDTFYELLVVFDFLVTAAWCVVGLGNWKVHESVPATAWLARPIRPIARSLRAACRFGKPATEPERGG